MTDMKNRITASFLLGACGDALGAPLEGIKSLKTITDTYGADGLGDIIEFKNVFETGVDYPAGRITDDTTMAMTTAASLILAQRDAPIASCGFIDAMRRALWQGFLNWGQHQDNGTAIADKIDRSIAWPDSVKNFWFHCGAGRGTIAALLQKEAGSVSRKVIFNCIVRGQETKSPNAGCGGMMRVAPIGLLPGLQSSRIFQLGCESAALTNGHPHAYVAAGITALLVHYAAQDIPLADSLSRIEMTMKYFDYNADYGTGIDTCRKAITAAVEAAKAAPLSLQGIDQLPAVMGYKNKFLAVPVLMQTIYALHAADTVSSYNDVKNVMKLAVNHSGDSDSVGAIVGNIIGAKTGTALIPADWLATLTQKHDIKAMADDYCNSFLPKAPAPSSTKKPGL